MVNSSRLTRLDGGPETVVSRVLDSTAERVLVSPSRMTKLKVRPHAGQSRVLDSTAFCTAGIAGTGGGKTANGYIWLLQEMVRRPGNIWIVAEPTEKMVQRILLTSSPGRPSLPAFMKRFDKHQVFLKSQGLLRHRLGTIIFASADNPESLQGAHVGGIWLDECGLMSREAYLVAFQRVGFASGRLLLTSTPYNMGWLFRDVFKPWQQGDTDFMVSQFSSDANPRYPKGVMERAERLMSKARFRMIYHGEFGRPEGMIFDCWDDDLNLVDDFAIPPEWDRLGGQDYGYNHPLAGVFFARDGDGVYYLYREHYKRESVIKVHAADLKLGGGGEFGWVGDPSAPQQMAEMRSHGIPVMPANNDVMAGLDTMYELIADGRFKVMRSCKNFVDELEGYVWKAAKDGDGFLDEPVKVRDDLMDAARYAVHTAETTAGLALVT